MCQIARNLSGLSINSPQTRCKMARSQWERAREEAGYPWLTPKHLRPAFTTDLSERGLEAKMVSDLLEHSSIAMTEKFYIKRQQQTACRRAPWRFCRAKSQRQQNGYISGYMVAKMGLRKMVRRCNLLKLQDAPVAQLDRAFDYESKGRVFESRRAHHKTKHLRKQTKSQNSQR